MSHLLDSSKDRGDLTLCYGYVLEVRFLAHDRMLVTSLCNPDLSVVVVVIVVVVVVIVIVVVVVIVICEHSS